MGIWIDANTATGIIKINDLVIIHYSWKTDTQRQTDVEAGTVSEALGLSTL